MKGNDFAPLAMLVCLPAYTAPVTYRIAPTHTYPSFAVDHMGGLSIWRGKFTETSGKVVYDKDAKRGSVEVTVNAASVDYGNKKLDQHVTSAEILDVAKFPSGAYAGTFTQFDAHGPKTVEGIFTLHSVTRPLTLNIDSFMCKSNPAAKQEVCGAEASGSFERSDCGIKVGEAYGFAMWVRLAIQVDVVPPFP